MRLDKSKPYAEIIGATNGERYGQGGMVFDHEGNQIKTTLAIEPTKNKFDSIVVEKRKPGRPAKQ